MPPAVLARHRKARAPAAPVDGSARQAYARHVRDWLLDQRARLKAGYLARPQPDRNLRQHAAIVDHAVARIAEDVGLPAGVAVVAVGGYGRGFLFPASDVDLLVLLAAPADAATAGAIEAFVGLLWDVGLEPGISVRTVPECLEEAAKDVTVDTGLLESRPVWGDAALAARMAAELGRARNLPAFLEAKVDEQRRRHARHHDVALNLEPNIKESPGGLRDLQTVLWIAKAAGLGEGWHDLAAKGLITPFELTHITRHRRVLIDLRIRLHYLAGRREDRLVFDHQTTLARELKLAATRSKLASEVLMRRYYLTAKAIWQMNSILLPTLAERILHRKRDAVRRLDDEFQVENGNIAARDLTIFAHDTRAIFRAFRALQGVAEAEFFEPDTLRALWRAVPQIDQAFRDDPEANRLFLEILKSPKLTFTLRRMSRYGVLGRYIPAFGRIVGQMQHDLFHVYSVDEHILMVVRNLRRLVLPRFAHEFPFCHELAREFARPEVLYLAALFHDIAKGRGGDHSELGKKDARRFCRALGLSPPDVDLVAWLVEMHLKMSATAQKQDLADPDVISHFAQLVGNERRLTALYLLTVADVRGTSPHVWNAWKAKLLEQLFRATRRLLRGDAMPNEHWIEARRQEASRLFAEAGGEGIPALWAQVEASYFQRFEAAEIAWHALTVDGDLTPAAPVVRMRPQQPGDPGQGFAVMVMTRDQPGLFARITGTFEKLGFDIGAARVYTTLHGYALDAFQVLPKSAAAMRGTEKAVEAALARAIGDAGPPPMPSGRMARQAKHFPIAPSVSLTPSRRPGYFELSVSCADRPGLLSSIARVFLEFGVDLHDARITTLGQRAEDVFVIAHEKLGEPAFSAEFTGRLADGLKT